MKKRSTRKFGGFHETLKEFLARGGKISVYSTPLTQHPEMQFTQPKGHPISEGGFWVRGFRRSND